LVRSAAVVLMIHVVGAIWNQWWRGGCVCIWNEPFLRRSMTEGRWERCICGMLVGIMNSCHATDKLTREPLLQWYV
jgi:hypothetical protein